MKKLVVTVIGVGTLLIAAGCSGTVGKAAATYMDGKKFSILESHWGAPTEKTQNEDGTSVAVFRADGDCVATFNMDAQGVIASHEIVGSCQFDAYNRLQNVQH